MPCQLGVLNINHPPLQALCHCNDCQKISGSIFSTNVVVPGEDFKVTGTPKVFTKTADSGNTIHRWVGHEPSNKRASITDIESLVTSAEIAEALCIETVTTSQA